MRIRRNIDLVQINLSSEDKYYLPENVDFRDKKISTISILTSQTGNTLYSPFDARTLVSETELQNFYLELYDQNGEKIQQNLCALNCNTRSNYRLHLDSKLSLKLSNISYVGSSTFTTECILLYVSYDEVEDDRYEPTRNVTVTITVGALDKVRLSDYIDEYIKRNGYYVEAIEAAITSGNSFYLDLREDTGKVFRFVPAALMYANGYGLTTKKERLFVDKFDVDFKNSWLYNAENSQIKVSLTFYY